MNIHERIEKWQVEDGVQIFHEMKLPENATFLDFGCGYGEYTIPLAIASSNSTVYAIDKNKKLLKVIKDRAEIHNITNIKLHKADGSLSVSFPDSFADMILFYDFIHGNTPEKLPIRFKFFIEAKRVLKSKGILSIAPFECENLRDQTGKSKKYSLKKLISEIEGCGFQFHQSVEGAIHFDYYHSKYHWRKLDGDMPFNYLEVGPIINFIKRNE